jgi:serine/threonine-protein kinase
MDSSSNNAWEAVAITFRPGDLLGKHLIMGALLGRGGTAEVYEAYDTRLHENVAVKFVNHQNGSEDARARLHREAQICLDIADPRLPCVHAMSELPSGAVYMVMEKVEGRTLDQLIHEGPMAVERAARLTMELLDVLHNVHEHGYVHRDVKPSNIIVEPTPEGGERVRLIDFGVSKPCSAAPDATAVTQVAITAVGEIVGTPAYMAPEQLTGRQVDARVDVHAAGIVLYELLSGCSLYAGSSFGEIVAAVLRDELPNIRAQRPLVPQALADIIATATSKDPETRFDSAAAMALAMFEVLESLRHDACTSALDGEGREHAKNGHRTERGTTSGIHPRAEHRLVRRIAAAHQDEEGALGRGGAAVPHVA